MKKDFYWVLIIIVGFAMLVASIIIPIRKVSGANMIGGADWPVFWFYFRETFLLAVGGVILSLLGTGMLLLRRKLKR